MNTSSADLLEALNIDRGYGVQQLLAVKDQNIFHQALAPDIQNACLNRLLPLSFQDYQTQGFTQEMLSGKQPGFEERLTAYTIDPATYHRYVRFVLGMDMPLQHNIQGHSLKTMAKLLGFSYVIWHRPSAESVQLKEVECVLNIPPLKHVLYHPPVVGDPAASPYGRYELLKEESSSGTFKREKEKEIDADQISEWIHKGGVAFSREKEKMSGQKNH